MGEFCLKREQWALQGVSSLGVVMESPGRSCLYTSAGHLHPDSNIHPPSDLLQEGRVPPGDLLAPGVWRKGWTLCWLQMHLALASIILIKWMSAQSSLRFLRKTNVQLESNAQRLVLNFIITLLASNINTLTLPFVAGPPASLLLSNRGHTGLVLHLVACQEAVSGGGADMTWPALHFQDLAPNSLEGREEWVGLEPDQS